MRISFAYTRLGGLLSILALATSPAAATQHTLPADRMEEIRVVRDRYGVPHVSASTDEDAYFGLGYACAEDRLFQMIVHRLVIRGRTAEFFGRGTQDAYLKHDYKMRMFGYYRIAQKVMDVMDPVTRELLDAYADGVNQYVEAQTDLHPYFETYGIPVGESDPWTARDCVAMWFRIARRFTPAEPVKPISRLHQWEVCRQTNTVATCRNQLFPYRVFDETAPAVLASDATRTDDVAALAWLLDPARDPGCAGPLPPTPPGADPPEDETPAGHWLGHFIEEGNEIDEEGFAEKIKFSHAWAVAGAGSRPAALFGDPRIQLRVPNPMWEAHIKGATFEVRGVCFPGSPNFIVGSNRSVAWSVTALALAQADLFELTVDEMDVADPSDDVYLLDGQWLPFEYTPELIEIRGESPNTAHVRECHWGFVITESPGDQRFSPAVSGIEPDESFAVKWVPNHLTSPEFEGDPDFAWNADSETGFHELYAATDVTSFRLALAGWTVPGVNCVFADDQGRVGYSVVGALPVRSRCSPLGGNAAPDGSATENQWEAIVPSEYLPWVEKDPTDGSGSVAFAYSANHLPASASWYKLPLANHGGHTPRSRRIKELLLAVDDSSGDLSAIRAVHDDKAWIVARDLALLGDHYWSIKDPTHPNHNPGHPYNTNPAYPVVRPEAQLAIAGLLGWAQSGGQLDVAQPVGSTLAHWTRAEMRPGRPIAPALLNYFGAGGAGVQRFLRVLVENIIGGGGSEPLRCAGLLCPDEAHAIVQALGNGWMTAVARSGVNPGTWPIWFTETHLRRPPRSAGYRDCNCNGVPDSVDLQQGTSPDCNGNGAPDECELARFAAPDCNANGIPDGCEGLFNDCNCNGVPDNLDILAGTSLDADANGVPDDCQYRSPLPCSVPGLERWIDLEQLDSFRDPSDSPQFVTVPPGALDAAFSATILSQFDQVYSQWVVLHPAGESEAHSVLPFGQSETMQENDPNNQRDLWQDQALKSSPFEGYEQPTETTVLRRPPGRWEGGLPKRPGGG